MTTTTADLTLFTKVRDRYRQHGLLRSIRNAARGAIQRHGSPTLRRLLWNVEFRSGAWDFCDTTKGDVLYPILERYTVHGDVLDLGCGAGNTAIEMRPEAFRRYTGIDIADAAAAKARTRALRAGLSARTTFGQGDIPSYVPTGNYQVILFRESLQYIKLAEMVALFDRYASFLEPNGVFIVRMQNVTVDVITDLIARTFPIVERVETETPQAIVLVFRPRH